MSEKYFFKKKIGVNNKQEKDEKLIKSLQNFLCARL